MKQTASKYISLLAVSLALLTAETSPADVITLQPMDDAYLSNSGPEADQTWDNALLEQFGYYGSVKRPLLKFDLNSIPDGTTRTLIVNPPTDNRFYRLHNP